QIRDDRAEDDHRSQTRPGERRDAGWLEARELWPRDQKYEHRPVSEDGRRESRDTVVRQDRPREDQGERIRKRVGQQEDGAAEGGGGGRERRGWSGGSGAR